MKRKQGCCHVTPRESHHIPVRMFIKLPISRLDEDTEQDTGQVGSDAMTGLAREWSSR